jgi:hypothetical protein
VSSLSKEPKLANLLASLRGDATFLVGWLSATPNALEMIATRLKLDEQKMTDLLLCRAPRPQLFPQDVVEIARYVGVRPTDLAAVLREAASAAALSGSSAQLALKQTTVGAIPEILAAARDSVVESIPAGEADGDLRLLAGSVWTSAPSEISDALDIDAAIAWAAPLAVVRLPRLTLNSANTWLASQAIRFKFDQPDRSLRGLLLAWRGNGLVLIDGTLSRAEHRFTLAHEFGHFLIDYLATRERVITRAPKLLEVLDGYRSPTYDDRALAAVQQAPLGVHTHLVDRQQHTDLAWDVAMAEDRASRFALELLCPWPRVLGLLRNQARLFGSEPYDEKLRVAAEIVKHGFALPPSAAHSRAKEVLTTLGVRRGFFER